MEISPEDFLLTLAEVSITFAGFAALLAVFRRLGSAWAPVEIMGLWYMVAATVGALFFSLLPFLLFFFGLGEPAIWSVCCALLALFMVGEGFGIRHLGVRMGASPRMRVPALKWIAYPILGGALIVVILGVIQIGPFEGVAPYATGIVALLLQACIPLVTFLAQIGAEK